MRSLLNLCVLTVTLAFVAGAIVSGAAQASQEPDASEPRLSPQKRAEFILRTRKVAGLDGSEITAALRDPAAVEAVPVRARISKSGPGPVSGNGERTALAAQRCGQLASRIEYYNINNQLLGYFTAKKIWCWDYSAVTYAPAASVSGGVTQKGASAGWKYRGVVSGSEYYLKYNGRARGAHRSYRKGAFDICTPQSGCFLSKTPQVRITGYHNGWGLNEAAK